MPKAEFAARATEYARALDSFDAAGIASYYAKDAVARVAGASPIRGRDAIRQSLARFLGTVESTRHTHVMLWIGDDVSVLEADVTLTLTDRSVVTLPVTYVHHWRDEMIEAAEVRFYLEARLAGAISTFERADCALAA